MIIQVNSSLSLQFELFCSDLQDTHPDRNTISNVTGVGTPTNERGTWFAIAIKNVE